MKKIISIMILLVFGMFVMGSVYAAPKMQTSANTPPMTKKPVATSTPAEWVGNGTDDGFCSNNTYDENVEPGMQNWLFILTSPSQTGSWELTTVFDPDEQDPLYEISGDQKGNGSVHFTVTTVAGAQLKVATATNGTANSVLTVSHCEYNVEPLKVEKTAVASFERTWDWGIEKTAVKTSLGTLMSGEKVDVTYDIVITAESEDHDRMISGTVKISNPEGNPDAYITSIEDMLDVSDEVLLECDAEIPGTLSGGDEINCTYEHAVEHMDDKKNTVTVTTSGLVKGGEAVDVVDWDVEPKKNDDCIMVNDTNKNGPEDVEVCEDKLVDGEYPLDSYTVSFGKNTDADEELVCGFNEYENTADFVTNTSKMGESSVTVTVDVECPMVCSYSQGYWFSKPNIEWPYNIVIGGEEYTQAEGKAVFDSSNSGGKTIAKKAFLQLSAVMLSLGDPLPTELQPHEAVINNFFAIKSPEKIIGNNFTDKNDVVIDAAGAIADWIGANHCEDDEYSVDVD